VRGRPGWPAGEAPHLVFEGADAERVLEVLEANKL
jgi:hypothetical protein